MKNIETVKVNANISRFISFTYDRMSLKFYFLSTAITVLSCRFFAAYITL
jgi:hypothetical protein